jgi:plastocyanin
VRRLALLAAPIAAVILACGGSSPTPVGTPAVTIQLVAKDLAFDKSSFTVPAGLTFAIELNNQDAAPHDVDITGNGVNQSSEPFGGPATKTHVYAGLPAGTYTFLCTVHPDMKGTVESK